MNTTNSLETPSLTHELRELAKVSHTLFIPLAGRAKATLDQHGFEDPWARDLFERYPIPMPDISKPTVGFSICRAQWLDRWALERLKNGGTLIQLGPGLCSRALRLGGDHPTLEVDLPGVVNLKKKLFALPAQVSVEAIDFLDPAWCKRALELGPAPYVIIMEGVSMYLPPEMFKKMLQMMAQHFGGKGYFLFDYVAPIIARHTILLPSVYMTGARFSGNGFYRWQLNELHAQFKLERQLALPKLYLPAPWHLLGSLADWYSLAEHSIV